LAFLNVSQSRSKGGPEQLVKHGWSVDKPGTKSTPKTKVG